jgi:hypothetical protein
MPASGVLLLMFATALLAQNASVEGTVVNLADGQPLAGVHVRLLPIPASPTADIYGAISTPTGGFSMASVRPGSYLVTFDRPGFAPAHLDAGTRRSPNLTLRSGQRLTGFKLEMSPQSAISGRVLDAYGDPMQFATVRILAEGGARVRGNAGQGLSQTDDRGEFRLTAPPGRYYISATATRNGGGRMGALELRTDGTTPFVYATTWFPAATSQERATVIETKAGEDRTGIDIRLATRQNLGISGQLSGIPTDNRARCTVSLMFKRDGETRVSSVGAPVDHQGHFSFNGLEPALYTVFAQWSDGKARLQSEAQKIRVDSVSVTGVGLTLGPPGEIQGTFEISGVKPGDQTKRTVTLSPIDFPVFIFHADPAVIDKEGAFHVTGLAPASYSVEVTPLPENAYIKSLILDGTNVTKSWKNQIDLTSGARSSTLKIVAALNGGEITGTVRDKEGVVLTGAFVNVYLTDPKNLPLVKSVKANENGTFALHGIPPGKYRLFALDLVKYDPIVSEEIIGPLAAKGEEIEMAEGARLAKNLTPLPREAVGNPAADKTHANPPR